MASLRVVRKALAARVRTIEGLRVRDQVPGEVSPPAVVIVPGVGKAPPIDYDKAFAGGSHAMNFAVKILVGAAHDLSAQDALDAYLDPDGARSVKAAIEADMAELVHDGDVVADYAQVRACTHYGFIDWAGVTYLGAEMHCEVLAR